MEISQYIVDEAKEVLLEHLMLPMQLQSAPEFYLALASDKTVKAFYGFKGDDGEEYKIGTRN